MISRGIQRFQNKSCVFQNTEGYDFLLINFELILSVCEQGENERIKVSLKLTGKKYPKFWKIN